MNLQSADLRTPPLPLVACINCPELHKDVGAYFNANSRSPVFAVSLPEANETVLARLFGTPRQPKPFSTPDGILKADWFSKQRTRRASVAVTFVLRSDVEGDPTSWMRMTKGLQAVKAASAYRGVWLVLVVVQDGPVSDLPQDRITGLWNSFEPKQLVVISRSVFDPALPPEQHRQLQDEQLRPLQQLVLEAAAAYYTAASTRLRQKQLDLSATLGSCPPEISAAIAFKLGVFAEFRQDWPGAVLCYQAAAAALQGVPLGRPTVSCQRHAEVAAVAEVVHFKAMMLLLHQQRHAEAVQQLATHLAVFGRIPDGLPLAAAAAHNGWLARQYQTAADMISGARVDAALLQAHPEAEPCHLLMSAAQLALTRKNMVEQLMQMRQGPPPFDTSSVKRGRYLGQFERKEPEGPTNSCDLTDAEFCLYLEAEERRINHTQVVLDLLLQAQAAHLKDQQQQPSAGPPAAAASPSRPLSRRSAADRVSARLAYLIAEQQVETHNLTAARKLLLQVAYTYRRDGWDALLLHSLLLLRDVCQRLKLHKESLLHSLEVASLAVSLTGSDASGTAAPSLFDTDQAKGLASAALLGLLAGPQDNKSSLKKAVQQPSAPQQNAGQQPQEQQGDVQDQAGDVAAAAAAVAAPTAVDSPRDSSGGWQYEVQQLDLAAALQQLPGSNQEDGPARTSNVAEVLLLHKQQDFGWWRLISVAGGFVVHGPDPEQLCLCIALHSNLPVPLPLESATLTLSDAQGNWQQLLHLGPSSPAGVTGSSSQGQAAQQSEAAAATAGVTAGFSSLQLTEQPQQQQHQAAWRVQLQPGVWQQLHAVLVPRCIGTLVCEQVELQLSSQARVAFKVHSFAAGKATLGSSAVAADSPFSLQQQVRLGSWTAKVQHVGRLPQLQVHLPDLLLVGEFVPLDIRVTTSAAQPAAVLELSARSATGAPPSQLTLLAALPDGKLHELSLQSQQVLAVPQLPPGSVWTQHLWVRSRDGAGCRLTAALSCPAVVLQHADLAFRQPFEHRVRLNAEAGVHTLVGPSPAFAAVNGGSAGGGGSGMVSAAGKAALDAGPASAVPLVVGQSLLAQVLVVTGHAADLLLLGAELELDAASQLKLLNSLPQQLTAQPMAASPGSIHCLLLHLLPTAKASSPASIGKLKLTWRRKSPAAVVADGSSSGGTGGGSSSSGAAAVAAAAAIDAGPRPTQDVETCLDLPQVVVQDSLLSVKASGPQNVTAGTSFAFMLQVHNLTTQPQEVQVLVQDAQGFVFAGSKQQMINVVPRTIHNITWTLVAHASGQMQLPSVRVGCTKLGCTTVTQGGLIHVMPY